MDVTTLTGSTTGEFKINKPIHKLAIKSTGAALDFSTILVTGRITRSKGNDTYLFRNIPLNQLNALSTMGEGYAYNKLDAEGDIGEAVRFIEVGTKGDLVLLNDEEFKFEFSGLTAADSHVIHAIQSGLPTQNARFYKQRDIDSAVNGRSENMAEFDVITLDNSTVTELVCYLNNGFTMEKSIAEINLSQLLLNDKNVTQIAQDGSTDVNLETYDNIVIVPLNQIGGIKIDSMDVTTNAASDIFASYVSPVTTDKKDFQEAQATVIRNIPRPQELVVNAVNLPH